MRRLRPTKQSAEVVADWSAAAPPEAKQRLAELLRTLADGTWETRWRHGQYSNEPEIIEIRIDTTVHVFMRVFLDETDLVEYGDIMTIVDSDPN